MKLRIIAVVGTMALAPALIPAHANESARPAIGDTTVFATAPFPGHLFGVAVDHSRIYISTSRGDFFASPATGGQLNSAGERVFAYDKAGHLVKTTSIATMPNSDMGLFGLALDGNPTPTHKLYVADMNGRILRLALDRDAAAPELFAQVPPPFSGLGWHASMWNDLVFDKSGNLFMTDDKPRLWRVTPDGHASIWFTDPRLAGLFGFAGGPLGGRILHDHHLRGVPPGSGGIPASTRGSSDGRGPALGAPLPGPPESAAAAGDRSGLRRVEQSLRQPDWAQPDRGARPGWQRDSSYLEPVVRLAVGARLHGGVAACDQCRYPGSGKSESLERAEGIRRRDGTRSE